MDVGSSGQTNIAAARRSDAAQVGQALAQRGIPRTTEWAIDEPAAPLSTLRQDSHRHQSTEQAQPPHRVGGRVQ